MADPSVVQELYSAKNMNYTESFDAVSKNVTLPANWFLESNELELQDWKIVMTVVPSRLAHTTDEVDFIFQMNSTVPLIHTMQPLIEKTVSLLGDDEDENSENDKVVVEEEDVPDSDSGDTEIPHFKSSVIASVVFDKNVYNAQVLSNKPFDQVVLNRPKGIYRPTVYASDFCLLELDYVPHGRGEP